MKILSVLNVSNAGDLLCDSGFVFQQSLAKELVQQDIDFVLVGPDTPEFSAVPWAWNYKIKAPLGLSKYQVRYHFDWTSLTQIICDTQPDVILNNQIELAAAIRSILVTNRLVSIRLVSYCHYIPITEVDFSTCCLQLDPSLNDGSMGMPILLALCASALASDLVLVQSEFAKKLLLAIGHNFNISLRNRVQILHPPLDRSFLNSEFIPPQSRAILYNHRLYKHYGTSEVIHFIKQLAERLDFSFIVSDITPHRSDSRACLDPSPEFHRNLLKTLPFVQLCRDGSNKPLYRNMILNCRLGLAALRRACPWSMSVVDCMGLGLPIVAPNYGAYPEFVPRQLLFIDFTTAEELINRLLVDDDFWTQAAKDCHAAVSAFHPKTVAEQFLGLIEAIESVPSLNVIDLPRED